MEWRTVTSKKNKSDSDKETMNSDKPTIYKNSRNNTRFESDNQNSNHNYRPKFNNKRNDDVSRFETDEKPKFENKRNDDSNYSSKFDSEKSNEGNDSIGHGYNSRSNEGYNSRSNDGYNSRGGGYNSRGGGYNSRSNEGYNSRSNEGYNSRSNDGYNSRSNDGYNSRSNEGYNSRGGGYNSRGGGYNSRSNDGYNSRGGGYNSRNSNDTREKICFAFQKGECRRGDSCRFAHNNGQEMESNPFKSYQDIDILLNSGKYMPSKKKDDLIQLRDKMKEDYNRKNPNMNDSAQFPILSKSDPVKVNSIWSNKSEEIYKKPEKKVVKKMSPAKKTVVNSEISEEDNYDSFDEYDDYINSGDEYGEGY